MNWQSNANVAIYSFAVLCPAGPTCKAQSAGHRVSLWETWLVVYKYDDKCAGKIMTKSTQMLLNYWQMLQVFLLNSPCIFTKKASLQAAYHPVYLTKCRAGAAPQ